MGRKYVVKAKTGTYTDANGVEKNKYVEMGSVIEGKEAGKFYLKIEAIPVAWDGWAYLETPQEHPRRGQPAPAAQQRAPSNPQYSGGVGNMDEDIPF